MITNLIQEVKYITDNELSLKEVVSIARVITGDSDDLLASVDNEKVNNVINSIKPNFPFVSSAEILAIKNEYEKETSCL